MTNKADEGAPHKTGDQNSEDVEEDCAGYASFKPPDGGYGWFIVIAAFSVQFFVLGTMNNFGILFTKLLEEFKGSKQETCKYNICEEEQKAIILWCFPNDNCHFALPRMCVFTSVPSWHTTPEQRCLTLSRRRFNVVAMSFIVFTSLQRPCNVV